MASTENKKTSLIPVAVTSACALFGLYLFTQWHPDVLNGGLRQAQGVDTSVLTDFLFIGFVFIFLPMWFVLLPAMSEKRKD